MKKVNWSSYAEAYDMLLEYNPAYQEIVGKFQNEVATWDIEPSASILDIGAGTGNFTLVASQTFPNSRVFYVDFDAQMAAIAKSKALAQGLNNINFVTQSAEFLDWSKFTNLKGIVCVHALYALKNPQQIINNMYQALQPGGYLFLCDSGRTLNILKWIKFHVAYLMSQHGLLTTVEIFWRGRQIFKQNRIIRQLQLNGTYWVHGHDEFCKAVTMAGFKLLHSEQAYQGCSDLIIAKKYSMRDQNTIKVTLKLIPFFMVAFVNM